VVAAEDSLHALQSIHFIHLFDRSKEDFLVNLNVAVEAKEEEDEAGVEAVVGRRPT
jgi:hypothetical protein